jgi:hypothetical protein
MLLLHNSTPSAQQMAKERLIRLEYGQINSMSASGFESFK